MAWSIEGLSSTARRVRKLSSQQWSWYAGQRQDVSLIACAVRPTLLSRSWSHKRKGRDTILTVQPHLPVRCRQGTTLGALEM